jgi:hypothetical protein
MEQNPQNRMRLLQGLKSHAQGQIDKHKANVEVYLSNTIGIGEHSDIVETIEKEVDKIAHYQDQLDTIEKHFEK